MQMQFGVNMFINYIDILITIFYCDLSQVTPISEEFESKIERIFKNITSVSLCLMLEQYMEIYKERYDLRK